MITIAKRFTFDAAHCVPTMPDGHKCRRQHGNTYEVEFVLRGKIPESGILLDYSDIATAWAPVNEILDHRNLNDIAGLEVPTTENLVVWVFRWFYTNDTRDVAQQFWALLKTIRIKESATTWAEMSKVEFIAFYGEMA